MSEAPVAAGTSTKQPRFKKLSPGPGRPAAEVAEHQRARIHSAMVELVAERGYDGIILRDIADVAKVSTRAFYKHFGGKEDCFLRTHELIVRRTAKRVVAAQAGERDWHERLRLGFRAFIRELEREPQAMHLALVDVYLDGPLGRAQARKAELLFGAMLAESFGHAPDGLPIASLTIEAIVAGVAEVARGHILAGTRRASPRIADELMEWALVCRRRALAPLPEPPPIPSSKPATVRSRSGTSDRDLSLAAVEKLALTHGYAQLTEQRIRAAAGISRQRFSAEFASVDDCLSAARAKHLDALLAKAECVRRSTARGEGTREAVLTLAREFAEDPGLARLCFAVDCAGPRCLAGDERSDPRLANRLAKALYGDKAAKRPSIPIQASVGMVWTMMGTNSLSGSPEALHRAAPLLAVLA